MRVKGEKGTIYQKFLEKFFGNGRNSMIFLIGYVSEPTTEFVKLHRFHLRDSNSLNHG